MKHLRAFKLAAVSAGILALIAGAAGVLAPGMYAAVVPPSIVPGMFTQDLVVVVGALLLMYLAATLRASGVRSAILAIGILGFFFYAYGIYGIEQVYTPLYVLYLAVWAVSFYALVVGMIGLDHAAVGARRLPAVLRIGAAAYGIAIAVMFNVLWIGRLVPLLRTADRVEYLFSVYVIDLVFIMPAFVIAAILAVRRQPVGIAALPALFVLGVGILSPLALAELLKEPRYGVPADPGELALYGGLAGSFAIFAFAYLRALRPAGTASTGALQGKGRREAEGARRRAARKRVVP